MNWSFLKGNTLLTIYNTIFYSLGKFKFHSKIYLTKGNKIMSPLKDISL